ncbi:endonuclease/exonuclease/phosphatase family protein [Spirosoma daeguense]
MIMITLPVAIFLNLVIVILWLTSRPWRSWLSGLVVIVGLLLFGSRTFVWNTPKPANPKAETIKVFSYNAHTFGLEDYWTRYHSSPRARRIIDYVLRYDAPIKCFQEFATDVEIPDYDMATRFKEAGYKYSEMLHPHHARSREGYIGVALFSKYPIVASGSQIFYGVNGLVWANIKVGNDTIRVINIHLQSMGIRVGRVLRQEKLKEVQHETRGVLNALRNGFIERYEQVKFVENYIKESPYPVIVTGDHNDTPYSVVYERLRRILPNSFEEAGRGFGFTYNRLPGFIRIDHQFHDPKIAALNFETINYIRYSDHYPIVGTYQLKK